MLKRKKGESLIGIVIGMFILGFTLMGIISILTFNKDVSSNYSDEIYKYFIKSNGDNLIKKIDSSSVDYDESFYIYKDTINKEFKILTGSSNENYSYVDKLGNLVEPANNIGKTYKRLYSNKIDVLKHSLNPEEIPNLIMKFDATNIDGTNNSTYTDGESISNWNELINNFDATQSNSSQMPTYDEDSIYGHPGVVYDGGDILKINNNILINNESNISGDCGIGEYTYNEKSFAIVFKTGMDVINQQAIYEQGGVNAGYNFMIYNGNLYAGIHNKAPYLFACLNDINQVWDTGHQFKSVDLGEIIPDTVYFIMIVQDSTHFNTSGQEIDTQNKLQIYMNGELVKEKDHIDPQIEHRRLGFGGVNERNVRPWNNTTIQSGDGQGGCDTQCLFFKGSIGEFLSWNHALTQNEVRGIQNYFSEKWLGGYGNIFYNIIDNETKKYNN